MKKYITPVAIPLLLAVSLFSQGALAETKIGGFFDQNALMHVGNDVVQQRRAGPTGHPVGVAGGLGQTVTPGATQNKIDGRSSDIGCLSLCVQCRRSSDRHHRAVAPEGLDGLGCPGGAEARTEQPGQRLAPAAAPRFITIVTHTWSSW